MSRMKTVLDIGSTAIVTVVAVMVGMIYVRDGHRDAALAIEPDSIENWRAENDASGVWIGDRNARIVITEFMDFQCPYCAVLVPEIESLVDEFSDDVAVVFQHFPLKSHVHSIPAAKAAECAERQDRFRQMYRTLFSSQSDIGVEPWSVFARDAKVPDVDAFTMCMTFPVDSFPRIQAGRSLGDRTGVRGTPTTWLNGVRQPLDIEQLRNELRAEQMPR
jgi:protein-disulfide isomerase